MRILCFFVIAFCAFLNIQAQEFNGYWEAQGFGLFAEISDDQIDLYSYNSISLVPLLVFPLNGNLFNAGEDTLGELTMQDDLLKLTIASTLPVAGFQFESVPNKPAVTEDSSDPVVNFDIFWTTFEEYCSLFPVLEVDWQAQYDLYRPQIDSTTTDSLLFEYMGNMIRELNDGHCYLVDEENQRGMGSGQTPTSLWVEHSDKFLDLLLNKYLDEGSIKFYSNNTVAAGTFSEGNIGYLIINSFEIGEELEWKDNMLFAHILDEVLDSLKDTESLIIDVRNNPGGFQSNARILGNRLTKVTQPVFSVQNRLKDAYDSFSEPITLEITPDSIQYVDKPVMVLTSNYSASATDGLALLAKEIDCVTVVGDTTEGIFSGIIHRRLPNNWFFSLSTQRYLDVNGVDHEQIGVAPDILVKDDFDALMEDDVDNVLEYAIEHIASSCEIMSSVDLLEKPNLKSIKVYPNPFTHSIIVDASIKNDPANMTSMIAVYNIFGIKVFEQGFENEQTINLSELPNGLYSIVIETAHQTIHSKIVKSSN